MKHLIFFLLLGIFTSSPLIYQNAFANHISGVDDVFTWREHDVDNTVSVWCDFKGIAYETDKISLHCEGGTFDGQTRYGALYIMKVFDKADLRVGGGGNVFTWTYDFDYTGVSLAGVTLTVMDGAYNYTSLTEPGGFPNNVAYVKGTPATFCTTPSAWSTGTANQLCLGNTQTDLANIFGGGSLLLAGATSPAVSSTFEILTEGDNVAQARTVSNALWGESTQSQVTVILMVTPQTTSDNIYIQPRVLEITGTPLGTMTWNFPETTGEATDWSNSLGYTYQLNGTTADYGNFYSYDPFVPDPPTDLFIAGDTTDLDNDLDWTTPAFDGYSPITGYKIERESPVGGGFSTLVANTGTNATSYPDAAITVGNVYNYRVRALNTYGESLPSNESVDGTVPIEDETASTPIYSCPSTDDTFQLFQKEITSSRVGMCWDVFNNATNIIGYQINYTSPWGSPVSVIVNNTGTDDTRTYLTASVLEPDTQYSFQIRAWPTTNQTNILNVTTMGNQFDLGNFVSDAGENPQHLDFFFSKVLVNATTTLVNVDFTNTVVASCNVESRFAKTNTTYANMNSSVLDATYNRTVFTLDNVQNDVIYFKCYGTDNVTSTYIVTQESYPFLEQIQNFRNGTYGTAGQFGGFDLITLLIIIISMIGFNRVNAAVGTIFTIITVGALATLNIITLPTVLLSVLALVVLLAITSHSKDDISD